MYSSCGGIEFHQHDVFTGSILLISIGTFIMIFLVDSTSFHLPGMAVFNHYQGTSRDELISSKDCYSSYL
ncbi:hypothetical protein ACHQM5_003047 [Ranunculus cassubicifolius]